MSAKSPLFYTSLLTSLILTGTAAQAQNYYIILPIKKIDFSSTVESTPIINDTCKTILDSNGSTGDGLYIIKLSGGSDIQAYCDMSTNGGGWTLVLNYLHAGGTTPSVLPLSDRLPHIASNTLGADESTSPTAWSHTDPLLFSALAPSEIRFQCQTSSHTRKMNFITTNQVLLNYFSSGIGGLGNPTTLTPTTLLPDNTTFMPETINSGFTDKGNLAMTNFTFYKSGSAHWGVAGAGATKNRWACDDYPNGPMNDTLHRIWVR